jgi:hypothetical protein
MASTMPATAASTAAPAPIPFSRDVGDHASGGISVLIAACLLAAVFVLLWLLRRRGWRSEQGPRSSRMNRDLVVVQRLRLSTGCLAYVLQDGSDRLLVVEARGGIQMMPLRESTMELGEGERS